MFMHLQCSQRTLGKNTCCKSFPLSQKVVEAFESLKKTIEESFVTHKIRIELTMNEC